MKLGDLFGTKAPAPSEYRAGYADPGILYAILRDAVAIMRRDEVAAAAKAARRDLRQAVALEFIRRTGQRVIKDLMAKG